MLKRPKESGGGGLHLPFRKAREDVDVSMEPTTAARASTLEQPPAILFSGMGWKAAGAEDPYGPVSPEMSDSRENGDRPAKHQPVLFCKAKKPPCMQALLLCVRGL